MDIFVPLQLIHRLTEKERKSLQDILSKAFEIQFADGSKRCVQPSLYAFSLSSFGGIDYDISTFLSTLNNNVSYHREVEELKKDAKELQKLKEAHNVINGFNVKVRDMR